MGFNEIIGHSEIIKALESSLASGKTGHAYLFTGPAGVGKKTLAKSFAIRLLCPNGGAENCGCNSCRRFRTMAHPDFNSIIPTGNTIKIEQLRDLQHQAYFSPVMGNKKVYFFPDAESLTDVAANSFLKLLEEAPPGIIFIFTAVRSDCILPTIRSRCQVFNLYPVPLGELAAGLRRLDYSQDEAERLSALSQGLPGRALQDDADGSSGELPAFSQILEGDLLLLFKLAEELEKKDRKTIMAVLLGWEAELRTNLLELRNEIPQSSSQHRWVVPTLKKLAQAISMCEANVNIRVLLEEFFIFVKLAEKR